MSSIGGGGGVPPKVPPTAQQVDKADAQKTEGKTDGRVQQAVKKAVDAFEKGAKTVQGKLQTLSGQALMAKLKFSNTDLAVLAATFSDIVRKNPNADRKKRSKLFAKAILKKKGSRLSKLLDEDDEEKSDEDRRALEEMYDLIAEQLDSAPVFAQLVDEVTESARKIR